MKFSTINPATEAEIKSYQCLNIDEVNQNIDAAHLCFQKWRKTSFPERQKLMLKVTDILLANKQMYAHMIAEEMGKPITLAIAEVEKCALVTKHYANSAANYMQPEVIKTELQESFVCYEPLGVIFAIMPWNYPFWQVFRFVAPNIMAGNVAILKHAPNTLGAGEAIAEIFLEAGFPKDTFQHFIMDTDLAAKVIEHPFVHGVTLTGSERAGRIVAASAGQNLKKSVLELGGSDPFIVLQDADLDLAAKNIVASRLNNSGQVCISAKRIIVDKNILAEITEKIRDLVAKFIVGDPLDPNTNCGPLARDDLRIEVHKQVQESIKCGAKLLMGGVLPAGKGYFYPPTILTNVTDGMPAFNAEIFGPVISIISAENEADAIKIANNTRFGLSSAIFSKNIEKAKRIAQFEIEAGSCFINSLSASNPLLPFGGIKSSGFGRELAKQGMLEFINTKTIGISG